MMFVSNSSSIQCCSEVLRSARLLDFDFHFVDFSFDLDLERVVDFDLIIYRVFNSKEPESDDSSLEQLQYSAFSQS